MPVHQLEESAEAEQAADFQAGFAVARVGRGWYFKHCENDPFLGPAPVTGRPAFLLLMGYAVTAGWPA
jgi:hypothetical protein